MHRFDWSKYNKTTGENILIERFRFTLSLKFVSAKIENLFTNYVFCVFLEILVLQKNVRYTVFISHARYYIYFHGLNLTTPYARLRAFMQIAAIPDLANLYHTGKVAKLRVYKFQP